MLCLHFAPMPSGEEFMFVEMQHSFTRDRAVTEDYVHYRLFLSLDAVKNIMHDLHINILHLTNIAE